MTKVWPPSPSSAEPWPLAPNLLMVWLLKVARFRGQITDIRIDKQDLIFIAIGYLAGSGLLGPGTLLPLTVLPLAASSSEPQTLAPDMLTVWPLRVARFQITEVRS